MDSKVRIEYGKNAIVYQISPNPDTKLGENNIIALVKDLELNNKFKKYAIILNYMGT